MNVLRMRVLDRRTPSRTVHIFNRNMSTQLGPSVGLSWFLRAGFLLLRKGLRDESKDQTKLAGRD